MHCRETDYIFQYQHHFLTFQVYSTNAFKLFANRFGVTNRLPSAHWKKSKHLRQSQRVLTSSKLFLHRFCSPPVQGLPLIHTRIPQKIFTFLSQSSVDSFSSDPRFLSQVCTLPSQITIAGPFHTRCVTRRCAGSRALRLFTCAGTQRTAMYNASSVKRVTRTFFSMCYYFLVPSVELETLVAESRVRGLAGVVSRCGHGAPLRRRLTLLS